MQCLHVYAMQCIHVDSNPNASRTKLHLMAAIWRRRNGLQHNAACNTAAPNLHLTAPHNSQAKLCVPQHGTQNGCACTPNWGSRTHVTVQAAEATRASR